MKNLRPYILTLMILFLLCSPVWAGNGQLSGEVMLDYATYLSQEGAQENEQSHFAKRLGLFYKTKGTLMGGRLGNYNFLLGGEAVQLSTTDDQSGIDDRLDTQKIYYNADMTLAPAGLPFRLYLFARDTKKTRFVDNRGSNDQVLSGRELFSRGQLLNPAIYSDLSNGTDNTAGFTLLLGIRNGSYLGRYREMLSTLPRLLIDYKQSIQRDLKSFTPRHTRSRDLAFVSLNKKDNWLHYRVYDYTDYIDPQNNFERKQMILGVIDPTLTRKWINLTNWIQLSTDLTYTRETKHFFQNGSNMQAPEHRYNYNLFTAMTLPDLRASNYLSFERARKGDQVTQKLNVPFNLSFRQDRDSLWRFNWTTTKDSAQHDTMQRYIDRTSHHAQLNLETWRSRSYTLTLGLSAEQTSRIDADVTAAGFSLEVGTRSAGRRLRATSNDCRLRLESRWLSSDLATGETRERFEQKALVSYEQPVTQRWTLGITNSTSYSTGDTGSVRTEYGGGYSAAGLDGQTLESEDSVQNQLLLFAKHILSRNTTNSVAFTSNWLRAGSVQQKNYELSQRLAYRGRTLEGTFDNRLKSGDFRGESTVNTNHLDSSTQQQEWIYTHTSSLRYRPTRAFGAGVSVDLAYEKYRQGESRTIGTFKQNAQYSLWVTNGVIRKLAAFSEELAWERIDRDGSEQMVQSLQLQAEYFPRHSIFMGSSFTYQTSTNIAASGRNDSDRIIGRAWAGVAYSKFKFDINYAYGLRPETDTAEERTESRIQVRMTKVI